MADSDPDTWMWERARSMLDEAERVQRKFFQLGRPGTRRPSWEPPVDVFETATELWVVVALPGVGVDALEIELRDELVVVGGTRPQPQAFRSATVHRLEIPHGRFERAVPLPPGRYQLSRQELVGGCLFLSLAKLD
jgi:HSP20 family molecular chaperone IbpA